MEDGYILVDEELITLSPPARQVPREAPGYKSLTNNDTIKEGDEWFNPDWEVAGPWYKVEAGNKMIGETYLDCFRPMRRAF